MTLLEKCEGMLRGAVGPRRRTEGVKPDTLKGASPVLNGGDEETGLCRPRLVATQLECGHLHGYETWDTLPSRHATTGLSPSIFTINWLRVFRRARTAHLCSGRGPERETSPVPSEKCGAH